MLLTVLYLLLLLIIILLGSLCLPWKVGARGSIKTKSELIQGTGAVTVGGRSFGIMVRFLPEMVLCLGPYSNPWITKSLAGNVKKKKKKPPKALKEKKKKTISEQLQQLDQIPLWKKLIRSTLEKIHWERVYIDGYVGFSSPMITGLLMGLVAWLKTILPPSKTTIKIMPHFKGQSDFNLTGDLLFRLHPAILAISVGWVYIRNK